MLEPLEQLSNALHRRGESNASSRHHISRTLGLGDMASRSDALSHSTSRSSSQVDSVEAPKTASVSSTQPTLYLGSSPDSTGITDTLISPVSPILPREHTLKSPVRGQERKSPTRDLKSFRMSFSTKAPKIKPPKEVPLPNQPRSCFSSSGSSLVFWGDDTNWVMKFDISISSGRIIDKQKYEISGIQSAAVGSQRCAVITSVGEVTSSLSFSLLKCPSTG
jgi:hypothetical protein